jgi:hypothetical protein
LNQIENIAFIDEFGTNSLDFEKQHVSTHFIITCILINKSSINQILEQLNIIRQRNFQQGEMKSSNVGSDDKRRLKILSELVTVNFQILSLVVDKRKLIGEGFGYKPSFYKFLNGLVYNDLYKVFAEVDVIMDEHGSEKFMSGFISYIRKMHPPDLFSPLTVIKFQDSKENVLIQLADFISGTLARAFDETKKSPLANNLMQVIRKKIGVIKFFPQEYEKFVYEYDGTDKKIDPKIDELSLRRANDFIERNESDINTIKRLQVRTLKLLRLYRQTLSYTRYISTHEILEHLNYGNTENVTEYFFRTNVIAKLRDKDVLIASSSHGYKLPISLADLYDFINHGSTVVIPMVSRIRRCVALIKMATGIDITEKENYKELRQIIQAKQ